MTLASLLTSLLLLSLSLAGHALPSTAPVRRATTCNGDASLCSKLYSNVTFVGAHDSYGISSSGLSNVAANQDKSVTTQLNDGVRLLQAQAHKSTNSTPTGAGIDLCHTSCSLFQGGAIEYWLTQIKDWSAANPSEVLTLLIVNSDDLAPSTFATAFESTGLSSKMYAPPSADAGALSRDSWPTLGTLIDAGTPIVAFFDNSADTSSVDYLLPEFSNIWENPYDQTSTPFNCSVDRIGSGATHANLMYLINHFLDESLLAIGSVPDTDAIYSTNSESSVLQDADNCAAMYDAYPNFVLVDYYDRPQGDVFAAAAKMNGVAWSNTSSSSTDSDSDSSTASAAAASAPLARHAAAAAASLALTAAALLAASASALL